MPLPYLSTLNLRARMAYPIIQRGVRAGLSSRQLEPILREADLGLRRATLLDLMSRERAIVEHGRNLRYLPLDRTPNPDRLPEALHRIRRQYSYEVELRGKVLDVNEPIKWAVTVTSSSLLTRRQAEAIALEMGLQSPEAYNLEVESVQLSNVLKAGAFGTEL